MMHDVFAICNTTFIVVLSDSRQCLMFNSYIGVSVSVWRGCGGKCHHLYCCVSKGGNPHQLVLVVHILETGEIAAIYPSLSICMKIWSWRCVCAFANLLLARLAKPPYRYTSTYSKRTRIGHSSRLSHSVFFLPVRAMSTQYAKVLLWPPALLPSFEVLQEKKSRAMFECDA